MLYDAGGGEGVKRGKEGGRDRTNTHAHRHRDKGEERTELFKIF